MSRNYLFVYGTLLTSSEHPMGTLLRQHARLSARGSIQARLYQIDDPDAPGKNTYPGALPSPNPDDRVHGEVYAVMDPDTLYPAFDDFEACGPAWPEPHEFLLREVTVSLADGLSRKAMCYLYTWDVSSAQLIPSGRFTDVAPNVI
ncbi:MAG: gamma-glutamylcyclotransferase family protein [Pseudomonadota bacterium]